MRMMPSVALEARPFWGVEAWLFWGVEAWLFCGGDAWLFSVVNASLLPVVWEEEVTVALGAMLPGPANEKWVKQRRRRVINRVALCMKG